MAKVLITGANRGIGFEFARQYAAAGWNVIATVRHPEKAAHFSEISGKFPNIEVLPLDVTNDESVSRLVQMLNGQPIDLLINNAGIYPRAGTNIGTLNYPSWRETFETNVWGAMRVTEALLENVAGSERKQIAAISSYMGSISSVAKGAVGTSGTSYQYRTSKAAMNMAFSILAQELRPRGISVAIFMPGWVRTDMGGKNAVVAPEQSVAGMKKILDAGGMDISGKFLNYDGASLEW